MSIEATVENNTIKLPSGVHLPNGTPVRIETIVSTPEISADDPLYRLHEHATPAGSLNDRQMDALIYGG